MHKLIENTKRADQNKARAAAEYAYRNPRWTYSDIFAAYGRPSGAKIEAWNYCKRLCADLGGRDLRISSRNTFRFSAVFRFIADGREAYAYITPEYDRFCYADATAAATKQQRERMAAD